MSSHLTFFFCFLPPCLSIYVFLFVSVTPSFKHHSNLLQGIGCQETGFSPHCMSTKVEGVGGGVTISRTAENWRPGGLHSTITVVLKRRSSGRKKQRLVIEWGHGSLGEHADPLNSFSSIQVSQEPSWMHVSHSVGNWRNWEWQRGMVMKSCNRLFN